MLSLDAAEYFTSSSFLSMYFWEVILVIIIISILCTACALVLNIDHAINVFTLFASIGFAGRYAVSPEGVVTTLQPLTTAPDHVFDVVATDGADNQAVVHIHITIVGNKRGPQWIFPAFQGDKVTVCEVRVILLILQQLVFASLYDLPMRSDAVCYSLMSVSRLI